MQARNTKSGHIYENDMVMPEDDAGARERSPEGDASEGERSPESEYISIRSEATYPQMAGDNSGYTVLSFTP